MIKVSNNIYVNTFSNNRQNNQIQDIFLTKNEMLITMRWKEFWCETLKHNQFSPKQTFYRIETLDIYICAVKWQYIENRFWQSALLTQPTHDIIIINIIICIKVKRKFDWIYTNQCLEAHRPRKIIKQKCE